MRILILSKIKTLASNGKAYKNVPARQILNLTEQESISGDERGNAPTDIDKTTLDTGAAIGKCENFLIYTFVILGAYTAIAIIFTAKAIVRAEDMRKNSLYYLAGTLVNVSYSILVALIAKLLISYVESLPSTFTFSIT